MKPLSKYITDNKSISTLSNKERRKLLEKYLKHKNYVEYVEVLNKMLKDPKARLLIDDAFGGVFGDMKFDYSEVNIQADKLIPTQSDIYLDKSVIYSLNDLKRYKDITSNISKTEKPIVTYKGKYILDGHHTWFEVVALNPNAKVECINYDSDISVAMMLKAVQGAIASVLVDKKNNNNGEKLPLCQEGEFDIYEMNFNEIKRFVKDNIINEVINYYASEHKIDKSTVINHIAKRLLQVKLNIKPLYVKIKRDDMPQIYKGGLDRNDEESALPNKKYSAMWKLKNKKTMKDAIS